MKCREQWCIRETVECLAIRLLGGDYHHNEPLHVQTHFNFEFLPMQTIVDCAPYHCLLFPASFAAHTLKKPQQNNMSIPLEYQRI